MPPTAGESFSCGCPGERQERDPFPEIKQLRDVIAVAGREQRWKEHVAGNESQPTEVLMGSGKHGLRPWSRWTQRDSPGAAAAWKQAQWQ